MIHFVSMVNYEGLLLAMTEGGAVWQFHPTGNPAAGRFTTWAWTKQ
jgi:hypothetical protein